MRPKIRIYKYLNLFLDNLNYTVQFLSSEIRIMEDNKKTIFEYWKANPDQRLNQVLFNLFGFVGANQNYHIEDFEYLASLKIPKKDLVLWGTMGKDGNGPFKHIWLADMDSDHIKAILDTQKDINKNYKEVFIQELADRGDGYSKYGVVHGEIKLLEDLLDGADENCEPYSTLFCGNYLPNLNVWGMMEEFHECKIDLYADYIPNETSVLFFEIVDSVNREDLIKLLSVLIKHSPDEFNETSDNVFRLCWD